VAVLVLVLSYAPKVLRVLARADQLGELFIVGDDDQLEIVLQSRPCMTERQESDSGQKGRIATLKFEHETWRLLTLAKKKRLITICMHLWH
jgi:hypothetical protein